MKKILALILVSLFLINCEGTESTIQSYEGEQDYNAPNSTSFYNYKTYTQPYKIGLYKPF